MPGDRADLTDADLDRWEALAAAATPGPWTWEDRCTWGGLPVRTLASDDAWVVLDLGAEEPQEGGRAGEPPSIYDAALIAAAREAVPALVAEVRRLRWRLHWGEAGGLLREAVGLPDEATPEQLCAALWDVMEARQALETLERSARDGWARAHAAEAEVARLRALVG